MLARLRRRILQHYQIIRPVLAAGFLVALAALVIGLLFPLFRLVSEVAFGPVNVFSVLFSQNQVLKSDQGRTNVLLLGVGGPQHDGPDLTDTIMVASFKLPENKTATTSPVIDLISLPRDIYLDSLGGKINTAYSLGMSKSPDVGLAMAKATVTEVSGLPIHYVIVIDFSVFEKVVNAVGGIDVNVEHVLDDPGYPVDGAEQDTCGYSVDEIAQKAASINISPASEVAAFPCRYTHLYFNVGITHMDGATALKFVRSRHAQGDEGTDFARAARQQLVLSALKQKVFSTQTLLSPSKILEIYNQLKSHINTDLNPSETSLLLNLALKFRTTRFQNIVLGLEQLENPPVDERGWVLLPKGGDWQSVHDFIKSQLQ